MRPHPHAARRHVPYHEDDTFGINASETLMSAWQNLTGSIFAVTIGIVAVFMVVGGIVIMNIMLATVTERTHEIGIRKSVGAQRSDIMWQFLIEAAALLGLGGLTGVIIAYAIARLVAIIFTAEVPTSAVIVGMTLSTLVGLFFGIYPAQKLKIEPPTVEHEGHGPEHQRPQPASGQWNSENKLLNRTHPVPTPQAQWPVPEGTMPPWANPEMPE